MYVSKNQTLDPRHCIDGYFCFSRPADIMMHYVQMMLLGSWLSKVLVVQHDFCRFEIRPVNQVLDFEDPCVYQEHVKDICWEIIHASIQ